MEHSIFIRYIILSYLYNQVTRAILYVYFRVEFYNNFNNLLNLDIYFNTKLYYLVYTKCL